MFVVRFAGVRGVPRHGLWVLPVCVWFISHGVCGAGPHVIVARPLMFALGLFEIRGGAPILVVAGSHVFCSGPYLSLWFGPHVFVVGRAGVVVGVFPLSFGFDSLRVVGGSNCV